METGMQPEGNNSKKAIITAVAVLVAITLIVGATAYVGGHNPAANHTTSSGTATVAADPDATYKDGTYSADSSYESPGGTEQMTVKITISNNTVTDSTVKVIPSESEAEEYQNMFLSGYKGQVVGKSVNSISLSRVSGSSLTSQGFNDALAKIRQQAAES